MTGFSGADCGCTLVAIVMTSDVVLYYFSRLLLWFGMTHLASKFAEFGGENKSA